MKRTSEMLSILTVLMMLIPAVVAAQQSTSGRDTVSVWPAEEYTPKRIDSE